MNNKIENIIEQKMSPEGDVNLRNLQAAYLIFLKTFISFTLDSKSLTEEKLELFENFDTSVDDIEISGYSFPKFEDIESDPNIYDLNLKIFYKYY